VATGSRPTHYAGVPFDDPDVYDSDEIYSLRRVPKDVVVGGGAVGVEFATVFTALGIPATLISRSDRLLPAVDGELAGLAAAEFERRGVRLILGADAEEVRRVDGRLTVRLSTGTVLATDAVLFAAGRTASIAVYGLPEVASAGATEEEVRAARPPTATPTTTRRSTA
jgi:NAD(P) transhydrogenase